MEYASGPLEIGFQARYLADITEQIGDKVQFRFSDGSAPTVVMDAARPGGALCPDADAGLGYGGGDDDVTLQSLGSLRGRAAGSPASPAQRERWWERGCR